MSLRNLAAAFRWQAEADALWQTLGLIAHEVGVEPQDASPDRVLEAVRSLRDRLNRLQGHSGTPRHADGHSVAFWQAGR